MTTKFEDYKNEYIGLYNQIQDLHQCMYGIQQHQHSEGGTDTVYTFICFFDAAKLTMNTTLADANMMEIKMLSDVPVPVLAAYGAFAQTVLLWQQGVGDFPAHVPSEQQMVALHTVKYTEPTPEPEQGNSDQDDFDIKLR